jgi:deoxyribonuclease V
MIACLDVDYRDTCGFAAGITFRDWTDAGVVDERVVRIADVQSYEAGQFFRRELPCLLAVLQKMPRVQTVIVDGYVWLDGPSKLGLGAHLYQALGERVPVIGVAKTKFLGAEGVCEVTRGASKRPLFVTAAGIQPEIAADLVRSMHGKYRLPTLLSRVDYLCRRAEEGATLHP